MATSIEQHVIWFHISTQRPAANEAYCCMVICLPVYVAHTVNGIECQDNFRTVESGRIFTDFIACQQCDEVTAWHVIHDHVQLGRQSVEFLE